MRGFHILVCAIVYPIIILIIAAWIHTAAMRINSADGIALMTQAKDILRYGGMFTGMATPLQLRGKPPQEPPLRFRTPYNKPLYPIMEAGVYGLFGASVRASVWTCFTFYALTCLALVYYILPLWGAPAAHAAAIAFISSYHVMFISITNQADMAFTFFMAAAAMQVFLGSRERLWLGGVSAAAAAMTRPNGILIAFLLSIAVAAMAIWGKDGQRIEIKRAVQFLIPVALGASAMFISNYAFNGGPFNYYDVHGLEFSGGPHLIRYIYYYPEMYFPGAQTGPTAPAGLLPSLASLTPVILREVERLQGMWEGGPGGFLLFLAAILWPPIWTRHCGARGILLSGFMAMAMQIVLGRKFHGHVKDVIWLQPFLCVAVGAMAGDIYRAAASLGNRAFRMAAVAILCALFFSLTLGSMARFLESTLSPEAREATGQQAEWMAEAANMQGVFPPNSLLIGQSPMEYMFRWSLDVYTFEEPGDFESFLGSLNKLKVNIVFHALAPKDIFSHRADACHYDTYPEVEPYARLVLKNRFLCLYRLDAEGIRKDFAPAIAKLPY
jgi:4-amino-4-deoxy-L-arabinose transferase-like glycosyltransferase